MRRPAAIAIIACFVVLLCYAGDFWEKPADSWNKSQALKMLADSPWAIRHSYAREFSVNYDGPSRRAEQTEDLRPNVSQTQSRSGENEIFFHYTMRLFSAAPIRDAFTRVLQIQNSYETLAPEKKAAFDEACRQEFTFDPDTIVVTFEVNTNDREVGLELERQLRQPALNQLRQQAYLVSERLGKIEISQYIPATTNGRQHKFVFPRQWQGQPVVTPQDNKLTFDFQVPVTDHKIYARWKPEKMKYRGTLEY